MGEEVSLKKMADFRGGQRKVQDEPETPGYARKKDSNNDRDMSRQHRRLDEGPTCQIWDRLI